MKKIYYKDIELSKREFNIIDNKKKYVPLHVFIYKFDVVEMLDAMYKFYSIRRHEIYLLYKGNKIALSVDKEFRAVSDHKINISRIKSWINFGTYKNFIIEFEKKYDERPNRDDYTEILYYLSINGYIPHIDRLEII